MVTFRYSQQAGRLSRCGQDVIAAAARHPVCGAGWQSPGWCRRPLRSVRSGHQTASVVVAAGIVASSPVELATSSVLAFLLSTLRSAVPAPTASGIQHASGQVDRQIVANTDAAQLVRSGNRSA